ncbi:MAG: ABC transporter ATP-binding protein/permease [Treponema sp.]|nr:ABC transporter ATP-binding protein/permease [Treponema sp.]
MSDASRRNRPRRGMGPGGGPFGMMPGEKAKNFKGSMLVLIKYLGRYRWSILIVSILAIISTIFTILGPKILGQATDELFSGVMRQVAGEGSMNFTRIGQILVFLACLYLASIVFSYLQGFVMAGITAQISRRLRNEINAKTHRLPLSYYDRTTHGDILSRITNDVDTLSQTLNQSLSQIITSLTSLVGVIIMMFSISWQLTLGALLVIPVSMVAVTFVVKKAQKHFVNQQKFLGSVNGHVEEMFGSHIVVKAFNGEADSVRTFDEYNNALYNSAWKANFLSGLMMPITGFIGNIAYVGICIVGGYFTVSGLMTVGDIQAFIQYIRSFMQPITQIANISNVLQQTAAAAERVFEFLNEPEEVAETAVTRLMPDIRAKRTVAFDHISFGYSDDKIVIHDFTATISAGQKIAIVGPTGAGKTTIVKLLMRFYEVQSGTISIDGHNIRDLSRDNLRSVFGMVLQDTWLFNGTIAENIRYGRLNATDDEVKAAALAAQVDHFVRTLPDSYNMILNEETNNISQGQRQLLTIARVILANPEILILDEATSNVDTRTELLIQQAMDNLMKDRTSFIIAHRLSTIRNADLILVLRDGDIVEQGTHTELLTKSGFYASLYNSQFEGAKAGD